MVFVRAIPPLMQYFGLYVLSYVVAGVGKGTNHPRMEESSSSISRMRSAF